MIYEWQCSGCGRTEDRFEHHPDDKGAETYICGCGYSMAPVVSLGGTPLLWAEEGRPRVIENLGHEPVTVRSAAEHRAAMKKAGVVNAGSRRGEKGVWV